MSVFIDTSALYAFVDGDDEHHPRARAALGTVLGRDDLVTHAYVTTELISLTQRRLGGDAVRTLVEDLLPLLTTVFIDEETHNTCVAGFVAALPTRISFVDFVSFHIMRERSISKVLAFDADFARQGFETLP